MASWSATNFVPLVILSQALWLGSSEGKSAIPVDLVLEPFFADQLVHDVDLGAEHLRKASFQLFQAPEVIEAASGKAFAEADRDIYIGTRSGFVTRDGAEQRQPYDTCIFERLFVGAQRG